MEAAVLRVKRKRGADPVQALIISCKRSRPEDVSTQVFKIAATVSSQAEPVQKYVQEAISRHLFTGLRCPRIGSLQRIQNDLRVQRNVERQESRYYLISNLRPKLNEDEGDRKSANGQPASSMEEQQYESVKRDVEGTADDHVPSKGGTNETFKVLDIVHEETVDLKKTPHPETIMCNSVKMIREKLNISLEGQGSEHRENPDEFVYDIYYAEASPQNWFQDILSVRAYYNEQELMADEEEPDEVYEDEDDENEENNWRNDYPDEEDQKGTDQEERYMGYYEDSDEDTEYSREGTLDFYRRKECDEEVYSD
ncbi:probable RNA polymerase II nuclear localization protein SLC7A6OS [Engystomops pustulosus]|uniref:probable RNA polymerase II nuclear localization protein SLC7A6OS n=1 Tax=Engystomops pustulosus TaxID=76066 RepID=UPI003AFAAB14